jgi:[ribosomal protein S5]-alanine N-acetyltransferase
MSTPRTRPDADVIARSPRLWLVRAPTSVLRARLERDEVDAVLDVDGELVRVHFPATWPGDALPLVTHWLELRTLDPRGEPWSGTLVERATRRAIGTIGCKAWPDAHGSVEVGYGIEPAKRRQGFATEALRCLLERLDAEPTVRRVVAETLESNAASQGVLARCGFARFAVAPSPEGPMLWWERRRP